MQPPPFTDRAYWDRLRRDRRSMAAQMLCVAAVMIPVLAVTTFSMGNLNAEGRGNPLFWLVLFPPGWWARRIADYEPWAVRLMPAALIAAPALGLAVVGWAWALWLYLPVYWLVPAASLACSVAGWFAFKGSLVDVEGPRR